MLLGHRQPWHGIGEARARRAIPGYGRATSVAPLERGPERDAVRIAQRFERNVRFGEPELFALEYADRTAQRSDEAGELRCHVRRGHAASPTAHDAFDVMV